MTRGGYGGQQGGYSPGGGYGAYAPPGYPAPATERFGFGLVGAVITTIGVVGVVVGFTSLDWLASAGFTTIHDAVTGSNANGGGLAYLYFAWLAWVLLAVAAAASLVAGVPSPANAALRGVGLIVGLAAAVLTFFAIKLSDQGSLGDYLHTAKAGYWVAVAGFVVIAIGAIPGPMRRR